MSATNCPNCGAPLKGHRCSYCETEMPDTTSAVSDIHMDFDSAIGTLEKLVNQAHMPPAWIRAMLQYQTFSEEYS